jgi:hypothetical protein
MAADAHGVGVFHAQLLDAGRTGLLGSGCLGLREHASAGEDQRRAEDKLHEMVGHPLFFSGGWAAEF